MEMCRRLCSPCSVSASLLGRGRGEEGTNRRIGNHLDIYGLVVVVGRTSELVHHHPCLIALAFNVLSCIATSLRL